jgi:hypothetical protein
MRAPKMHHDQTRLNRKMVWSAENRCHRVRDSTFDEGRCWQLRNRSGTRNFSNLREPTIKVPRGVRSTLSVRRKRECAAPAPCFPPP